MYIFKSSTNAQKNIEKKRQNFIIKRLKNELNNKNTNISYKYDEIEKNDEYLK